MNDIKTQLQILEAPRFATIPIICKQYTITVIEVERGLMVILRIEKKRRSKNGSIRYGMRYYGIADNYETAKTIAWAEYLETWQSITCPGCQRVFTSHWEYWRHQRFIPLGVSWHKSEQGDFECPVTAYGDR